jgi:N-acetylglucosaminyl-diphospho-decaprenol L-rhamnosyltransferase
MMDRAEPQTEKAAAPVVQLVTTVTVTYNSAATIAQTLSSMYPSVLSGINRYVVVDNQSSDGTADLVARDFPWVKVIRSTGNLGFARGCNLGFQEVETPYVLFLNPDAVVTDNALRTLLDFMECNTDVAISAPATRLGDTGYQNVGMLTTPGQLVRSALGSRRPYSQARTVSAGELPTETNWVCGAIMLVRSSSYVRAGGFDPRYFLYFDETDLFLRIHAQGERIFVVGAAEAIHIGAASSKGSDDLMTHGCITEHYYRSRYYYLVKNFGLSVAIAAELSSITFDIVRYLRSVILRRSCTGREKPWRRPFLKFPAQPTHSEAPFTGCPKGTFK